MQENKEIKTLIAVSTLFIAGLLLINLIVNSENLADWTPILTAALFLISFGFWAWLWVDERRISRTEEEDRGAELVLPQAQEWIISTTPDTFAVPAQTDATLDKPVAPEGTPEAYQEQDEKVVEALEEMPDAQTAEERAEKVETAAPEVLITTEPEDDPVGEIPVEGPLADALVEASEDEVPIIEVEEVEEPVIVAPVAEVEVTETTVDDLTIVEGIGPYYRDLLMQGGITTFAALANATEAELRELLLRGGASRIPRSIETWAEQALFASQGSWDELRQFQSSLSAGRRK